MLDEIFFVPFILFFNLLSEIRNKAKGQTLRFIFVTDDRLTLTCITFIIINKKWFIRHFE